MTLTSHLWRKCRAYVQSWGMAPERDDPMMEPYLREVRRAHAARDTRRKHAAIEAARAARHTALRFEVFGQ